MPDVSRFSVLVIDDDKSVLDVIRFSLEDCGFDVIAATNSKEGFDQLGKNPVDAVLSDLAMAGKDGIALLHELRATESIEIPFVVVTGQPTKDGILQAMQLGALDFITKPFDEDELRNVVRRACEIGRIKRQVAALMDDLRQQPASREKVEAIERLNNKGKLLRISNFKRRIG